MKTKRCPVCNTTSQLAEPQPNEEADGDEDDEQEEEEDDDDSAVPPPMPARRAATPRASRAHFKVLVVHGKLLAGDELRVPVTRTIVVNGFTAAVDDVGVFSVSPSPSPAQFLDSLLTLLASSWPARDARNFQTGLSM